MNILFLAPWSLSDPLSISTVIPHVIELSSRNTIDNIYLVSTECRLSLDLCRPQLTSLPNNVSFCPFVSDYAGPFGYILRDLLRLLFLFRLARSHGVSFLICRGSSSGIYGHRLKALFNLPYIVESFEPHADYMLQSGEWKKWGFKYLVQKHWERQIKRTASFLITVSHSYARYLCDIEKLSESRLLTMPCWADSDKFDFDPSLREFVRSKLGIRDRLCLIYVGKFGGLYSPPSVLSVLRFIEKRLGTDLFFICLTPSDSAPVLEQLDAIGLTADRRFVGKVESSDVPCYLNAADFAIDFWFSGPWSFACSPIKHAEYWMTGLPVLMRSNIGDESSWIEKLAVGSTIDFENEISVNKSIDFIKAILRDQCHKERIRSIAIKNRGSGLVRPVYDKIFG